MFYFLEAVNAPALCRVCVLDQEREIVTGPAPSDPGPVVPPADAPGAAASSPSESAPLPRRRPFDRRRITDPDPEIQGGDPSAALGSLPSGARQLRRAASDYVDQGRLDEAIECIRELALEIGLSESAAKSPSPSARVVEMASDGTLGNVGSVPSVAPEALPVRISPKRARNGTGRGGEASEAAWWPSRQPSGAV